MRHTTIQRAAARPGAPGRRAGSLRRAGMLALLWVWAASGCASGRRTGQDDGSPVDRPPAAGAAADASRAPTPGAGLGAGSSAAPGGAPIVEPNAGSNAGSIAGSIGASGNGAPRTGVAGAGRTGAVEVTVTWADAPPHVRRSPGRNACGADRSPSAHVHTLGGVVGAVVFLRGRDAGAAPAPAREAPASILAVRQCRFEPRVAVALPGQILAVINDDERRLDLRVERLAADPAQPAAGSPVPGASIALPVVGSRADLRWPAPGVHRLIAADTEPGFVVVPEAARAGVTNTLGTVRLAALPAGSYDVIVWHPPVDDAGAAIIARAPVTIASGATSKLTIPLTPR